MCSLNARWTREQSQGGAGQDSDYTFSTVPKEFLAIVHQNTVRTLPSRSHVPSLRFLSRCAPPEHACRPGGSALLINPLRPARKKAIPEAHDNS